MVRSEAMSFASPFPEVDIPSTSVYDFLFGDIDDADLDRVALVDAKSGRQTSYREMIDRIDAFAGALAGRGIGVGDVVGLLSPNSSGFAVAFHGILRSGATATTINALFTAKDIAKQLTDSNAKMLVTVTPLLAQAKEGGRGRRAGRCRPGGARRRGPGRDRSSQCRRPDGAGPARARRQLRPVVASRGVAVQLRHHRQPQGRDADPPQPGGQRRADPAAARDGRRRRRPRRAAVLPHLRNDGVAQRRSARAGPAGHHAELRSRRVPRQHREPQVHDRVHRAAGRRCAGQASADRRLRPGVAERRHVRRRPVGRRSRTRGRRSVGLPCRPGLRDERAEPGQPHHPIRRRRSRIWARRPTEFRRVDGVQRGVQDHQPRDR